MIIFLFGTWGSGKSYVGKMIQEECGLLHMEADIQFDKQMLNALHTRQFHQLDLTNYYHRVVSDIFNFKKRSNDFVVSQGIYQEIYRKMIFDVFDPDIRFVWVKSQEVALQKKRLDDRAALYGNPIDSGVFDYMLTHWEPPEIPYVQLINGPAVFAETRALLQNWGLCYGWDPN